MARLPGVADLGPTPAVPAGRPVADYSGGGAALAQGGRQLGTGLTQFGAGAAQLGLDESRYEYAAAHSRFLTGLTELSAQTGQATDAGPDASGQTLAQRHAEDARTLQQQAAASIADAPMRERFLSETAPTLARSIVTADTHARALTNNRAVADADTQASTVIDQGIASGDEMTREQLLRSQGDLYDGLVAKGALTPLQAAARKQAFAHQFASADWLHRADSDPQGVINELRAAPGSGADITNRIVRVEGLGKNPRSSAQGLGQFTNSTWLDTLKMARPDLAEGHSDQELLALRADPQLAWQMTDALRQQNATALGKAGLQATPGAQYLAHFLGANGATAVLQADPKAPVLDVLTAAVGEKRAQAMVAANPGILAGKLAGSVSQWADAKMGGAPAGSALLDMLRPDQREELLAHAEAALQKRQVTDRADFTTREQNAISEAYALGAPTRPLQREDFIAAYGAQGGPERYARYDVEVQTGATMAAMRTMPAAQRQSVVASLAPQAGDPEFALKQKAYGVAQRASQSIDQALAKDAAGFVVARLPAAKEAYAQLGQALADPTLDISDKQAVAQGYANTIDAELQRLGVPPAERRLLPQSYVEHFNKLLQQPAAAGGTANVANAIAHEAALWGPRWPEVYREMGKQLAPVARVIGAGVQPVAASVLAETANTPLTAMLKDQDVDTANNIKKAVLTAFKPLAASMAGNEGALAAFNDFRAQGEKLAAYYVMHGADSATAARNAFDQLVGFKYDFSNGFRVPLDAGVPPQQVAKGAAAARGLLGQTAHGVDLDLLPAADTMGGLPPEYLKQATISAVRRDGTWVTAPDEKGLALIYKDRAVRRPDGSPLILSWAQLDALARAPAATSETRHRAYLARHGIESAPVEFGP